MISEGEIGGNKIKKCLTKTKPIQEFSYHPFHLFAIVMVYYYQVGPHSGPTRLAPKFSKESFQLSYWLSVSLPYTHLHLKRKKITTELGADLLFF